MPRRWTTRKGQRVEVNDVQRAILDVWEGVQADWERPDYLAINGEPVDGPQKRARDETWAPHLWDQVEAASALINPLRARRVHMSRGSNYHVYLDEGLGLEDAVAQQVHAEQPQHYRELVPPEFYFRTPPGKRRWMLHFAHHIGYSRSGWMYRTTPVAKELMLMKLNESRKQYAADIIIRSHVHYHVGVRFKSHMGLTTPAWQFPPWYAYRRGVGDLVPEIGAIRLWLDDSRGADYQFPDFEVRNITPTSVKPPLVEG